MLTSVGTTFLGDPSLKARLVALVESEESRIRQWQSALVKDGEAVAGERPVHALLNQLTDSRAFAERYGFPVQVIILLERIGQFLNYDFDELTSFSRRWVNATPVGADLSQLPGELAVWMLVNDGSEHSANSPGAQILMLHRRELSEGVVGKAEWTAPRAAAVALTDAPMAEGSRDPHRFGLWEAAAWSVRSSRSILADMAGFWAQIAEPLQSPDWSPEDEARKDAILQGLWEEFAVARDAGEFVDFPALFKDRDSELERRFSTHLNWTTAELTKGFKRLADECVTRLSLAKPKPNRNGSAERVSTSMDAGRFNINDVSLIPRKTLFGSPSRFGGSISPDGRWLGWIAPHDGVNNVWVAPRESPTEATRITDDRVRGIDGFSWAFDGRHLIYAQDHEGDEQFHVYVVDRETRVARDLTTDLGRSSLALASIHVPDAIVVSSSVRDPRYADLYRIDLASGAYTLVKQNEGFDGFLMDDFYAVRIAVQTDRTGAQTIFAADGEQWKTLIRFDPTDARSSGAMGLDHDGGTLFLLDSRDRDTAALTAVTIATGECRTLYQSKSGDISGTVVHHRTYWPQACMVERERAEYVVLDESIRADIEQLNAAGIGDWSITSRSDDDRWWTVGAMSDTRPGIAWLFDRKIRSLTELYSSRPALHGAPLASMHSLTLTARDGLELVCYLTLPKNSESREAPSRPVAPLPMVLLVHGGPWVRDSFGYHAEHQWLANRGYAVLSVNFRGSAGFGKAFLFAGDGEWGAAMDNDLLDAVDWAIKAGVADPASMAIMGASYGGYATLSMLTRFPERFACGVDIVGPSNLETLLEATPAWWESARSTLYRALGDPATEQGRAQLKDRSPLHRASAIVRPLLIGQGANDPRVKQAEADQMAAAMRAHDIPVTYLLYPDEGHGFGRPQNALSFYAVTEAFLAQWLKGRCESITAEDLAGSSMKIMEGGHWLRPILASAVA